jgi:hypothetical protein
VLTESDMRPPLKPRIPDVRRKISLKAGAITSESTKVQHRSQYFDFELNSPLMICSFCPCR